MIALPLALIGAVALALWVRLRERAGWWWPGVALLLGAVGSVTLDAPNWAAIPVGMAFGLLVATDRRSPEPFLLGMLVTVGFLSGGEGAPGSAPGWLEALGLSKEAAAIVVIGARKAVHFSAYGLLAALAARRYAPNDAVRFGVGFAGIVATFDEARQHFTHSRSGSAWDVLLDLAGATIGTLVLLRLSRPRTVEA